MLYLPTEPRDTSHDYTPDTDFSVAGKRHPSYAAALVAATARSLTDYGTPTTLYARTTHGEWRILQTFLDGLPDSGDPYVP